MYLKGQLLLVAVACSALAIGVGNAPAAGSASYPDAAGDSNGGPDVRSVTISHDDANRVAIALAFEALSIDTETTVGVFIDRDRNAATGDDGIDAAFVVTLANRGFAYLRWNGTELDITQSQGARLVVNGTTMTLDVHLDDVGGSDGFDVWTIGTLGKVEDGRSDRAPDAGRWSYLFPTAARPPPPPAPPAQQVTTIKRIVLPSAAMLTPRAGKRFSLRPSVQLSDGRVLRPQTVRCTARVASVPLRAVPTGSCVWTIPTSARGKRLMIAVSVTHGGARGTQRLRLPVA
jgi:hypothetical protein